MKTGIYLIKNKISGKRRIGSATNIDKRWSSYKSNMKMGLGNEAMIEDVTSYGMDSFEWIVLELCSKENLFIREAYYLDLYEGLIDGYNSNRVIKREKYIRSIEEQR